MLPSHQDQVVDLSQAFNLSTTVRPSKPQVCIDYLTIDEAPIPLSVQRLIWEKKNAYPYFGLLYLLALRANSILELGIRSGRSTRALLLGLRDSGFGHLTSIDRSDLSPQSVDEGSIRRLVLAARNRARRLIRPGATWVGECSTEKTIKRLNKLGLSNNFTHENQDFFQMPRGWFEQHYFDLIWIDFDPSDFNVLLQRLRRSLTPKTVILLHNTNRREESIGIEEHKQYINQDSLMTFKQGSGLVIFTFNSEI